MPATVSSLELMVVAIEHRRHRIHLLRKQTQIEFGIALLDHATQKTWDVDARDQWITWPRPESIGPESARRHRSKRAEPAWVPGPICQNHRP